MHLQDNLKTSLVILENEKERINNGIFSNGFKNEVYKKDVSDFIEAVDGEILYLDSPYSGTIAYENEYKVLDRILADEKEKSRFSLKDGMDMLDGVFSKAEKFDLWVVSFGNAGGKNELSKLVDMVSKYRKCEAKEFNYRHCAAMATDIHKQKCKEWLIIGYNAN